MLTNSITNQHLRSELVQCPPQRGYVATSMRVHADTEGLVIVGAIDPTTMGLLSRGEGVATISDNPDTDANQINKSRVASLNRFSEAMCG